MKKLIIIMLLACTGLCAFALGSPIKIDYNDGVYHIVLSGKKMKKRIKFISSEKLITNREAHKKSGAELTINTGFFDPANQKTISYIMMDKQTVADPLFNENLLRNPELNKNIDKILDRTEFRVLDCDNEYKYEIATHKSSVDFGCFIETSAQGGPMLLPELRLEEEFFIVKDGDKVVRESASVLHRVERTLIGLKDDDVHIIIATKKHPMTIYEARDYCKNLGLDRAMAFDGGSSTSMNYKKEIEVISTGIKSDSTGRMLKSFMIVK